MTQRGDVHADFGHFASTVSGILDDRRGWTRAGVAFQPVESGGDFSIILASPEEVDAAHEVCSPQWSCRVGDQVLINDVRWRQGTDAWTGSIQDYRRYLINHEVGHWLGLGHFDCPGTGHPAPVMQQQSIDMQQCVPNGWPLAFEIEMVADQHGTTPLMPPSGGTAVVGDWNADGQETAGRVVDGVWYLRNSNSTGTPDHVFQFGRGGWKPVAGDWNGDGRDTPAMVSQRRWFVVNDVNQPQPDERFDFGRAGWTPVAGDWNADGRDTPAMVAQRRWFITNTLGTSQPDERLDFGRPGWTPVAGDWTGDGHDTPGVVAQRTWFLKFTLAGGQPDSRFEFGRSGWQPVAGDWNGNGQAGIGTAAQTRWFLRYPPNARGPVHVQFDY